MRIKSYISRIHILAILAIGNLFPSAAAAKRIPPDDTPFSVDAQVIDIGDNLPYSDCYFDCTTNGLHVSAHHPMIATLKRGDLVTLTALPRPNGIPLLLSIVRRGSAPLAAPVPCTIPELAARHDQPATVRGVLQSADKDETDSMWNWMTLQTPDGKLPVTARERDFPLDELRKMVDADVQLAGYPKPLNTWREGLGPCLVLIRELPQKTLIPAPPDAHQVPEWNGSPSPHRQRIRGTMVAQGLRRLYVKSLAGEFCEIQLPAARPDICPGDRIAVAGFVETTPDGLLVKEALIDREMSGGPTDGTTDDLTFDQLFPAKSGDGRINHQYYHRIIRIAGRILARAERLDAQRVLLLGNGRRTVEIDLSGLPAECQDDIPIGSTVRVTGLCLADLDYSQTSPANLHFRTFSILPRTAADIEVLVRPPSWTPARLLAIIGVLTIVLAAILIWNRSLTVLSQRRGRSLFKEQIARASAELRTVERTRLAVELHDTIAQNLTGAAFEIQTVSRLATLAPEKMKDHLDIVARTLKSCRDDIRNCIWDLRTNSLDQADLNQAIALALNPYIGNARLQTRFNVSRTKLSEPTLHALLRIIRELAINAVRHGHATEIKIAGGIDRQKLVFSVRDNGCGFNPRQVPDASQGHFGLQGVRERVCKLDGEVSIDSSPGRGTRIAVSLNLHAPSSAQLT